MSANERIRMVAPCGTDCGICEMHLAGSNEQLKNYLVGKGIPEKKIPCPGCRALQGMCPVIPSRCETYGCVEKNGVEYCFQCDSFPCVKLQPSSDRADILPHNIKLYNLCTIRRMGAEEFVKQSGEIKYRYFKGKMAVGSGPRVEEEKETADSQ